jgi:hypothetical protein
MTLQTKLLSFLLILLAYLCFIYVYQIQLGAKNILYTDYGKFYRSMQFFQANKNIYSETTITLSKKPTQAASQAQLAPTLNPPFFVLLTLPLGHLSYAISFWLWSLLSIACGIFSVLLCQKTLGLVKNKSVTLLLMCLLFSYLPTFINNGFGQIALLLLPFLVGAWHAARKQHLITAGILLGILISLKIIFALFLIYFIWRCEWRAVISLLITTLICSLLPIPILGWQSYINYHQLILHITWYAASWNASLYGFLVRLFGGNEFNTALILFPALTKILYPILSATLILGIAIFLTPAKNILAQQIKCDLDFSCVIVAMLLLSPFGWLYYFPWLLIVFFTIARIAEQHPQAFKLHIACVISIILSGVPHMLVDSSNINKTNVISTFFLSSTYVISLLLILGLLYYLRFAKVHYSSIENKNNFHYNHVFIYSLAILQSLFGIEYLINHNIIFGI